MYPYRREGGVPFSLCAFDSLFVPKGARNVADAKAFAIWLFRADNYIRFLHATPGHHLPVLNSVAASPAYLAEPLLHRYSTEVATMIASTARARNEVRPTPRHPFIVRSGEIAGSNILAEVVQRVVVEKSTPRAAAAWGADQLAALMKS
jgi:multiple sugar transport system substrate-binding protein